MLSFSIYMHVFGFAQQAENLRRIVEDELINRAARTLPDDSPDHLILCFMLSAPLNDSLSDWLCQSALHALVGIFRECSDLGELSRLWNKWRDKSGSVSSWVRIFGDRVPVDVNAALRDGSRIYYWCIDAIFAAFKRCVKSDENQTAVVLVKSNSMLAVDNYNDIERMQPRIRECAVRLTGALFHKISVFYSNRDEDELCMLIDEVTVPLAELDADDQNIFLRAYDKGFLRYPRNEMISFVIEVHLGSHLFC